jgi:hypothetical protein
MWLLIALWSGYVWGATVIGQYQTQERCEAARAVILQVSSKFSGLRLVCAPGDKP